MVVSQQPCELQHECLFLPSHFSKAERDCLGLTALSEEEAQLREGQATDAILQLRLIIKTLSAMQGRKKKNVRGQKESTRAYGKIHTIGTARDRVLMIYTECRLALKSLGRLDDPISLDRFPPLTNEDLYRKSTMDKRQLGDSNRADGRLWVTLGAPNTKSKATSGQLRPPAVSLPHAALQEAQASTSLATGSDTFNESIGTQSHAGASEQAQTNASTKEVEICELAKLWKPVVGLSDKDLEIWELEG